MSNYTRDSTEYSGYGTRMIRWLIVLFFVTLYCILVAGYSVFFQLRIRRWPSTNGTLSDRSVKVLTRHANHSERDYRASALYEYSVDGKTYQGHRVSSWIVVASHNARFLLHRQLNGIQTLGQDGVVVFYNPAKPAKSYLIKPGLLGLLVTVAVAIVPVCWYLLAYEL